MVGLIKITCACIIFKTIQVYIIWCILVLFAIDTVDLMYSVFIYNRCSCGQNYCPFSLFLYKRKKIVQAFGLHFLLVSFEVPLLFVLAGRRWLLEEILQIRTTVSLYLLFFSKEDKTKCIFNPFSWSSYNNCCVFIWSCDTKRGPLFKHVSPIIVSWFW